MFRLLFIVFLVIGVSLNATLLPKEIKEVHNILKKEYQDLSLVPGLVWVEGRVLENLAELSTEKKATIDLIKKFFNRDNPLTFRETRGEFNIVHYLNTRKIGKLVGILKQFKTYLSKNPKTAQEIRNITNPNTFGNNIVIKNKVEELRKVMQEGLDEATLKKVERTVKSHSLLLIRALLDSDDDISVFKALASLAYLKSENKENVLEYYQGLSSELGTAIFADDGAFLTGGKDAWLKAHFNKGATVDSYEGKVFSLLSGGQSWIEPYLTTYTTAYPTAKEAKGFGLPDCGEDSLLSVYRVLFAKEDGSIDLDLLQAINTPGDVLAFFKTYQTLDSLRTKAARDDWAGLLSQRKGFIDNGGIYVNRESYQGKIRPAGYQCEIKGGFNNMNKIILDVQGMDFDALINMLNQLRDKALFIDTKKLLDEHNSLGKIIVKTADRGSFEWLFQKSHFIFRALRMSKAKNTNAYVNSPQPERDLAALIPMDKKKLDALRHDKRPTYALLLNKINDDDAVIEFADTAFKLDLINLASLLKRIQSEDAQLRLRNHIFGEAKNRFVVLRYIKALEESNKTSVLGKEDTNHRTALHLAAFKNREEVIERVFRLMNPEAINAKDQIGETALHKAAKNGNEKVVKFLLAHMTPEAIDAISAISRHTALHEAALINDEEIVELLLARMSPQAIRAEGGEAHHLAAGLAAWEMTKNDDIRDKIAHAIMRTAGKTDKLAYKYRIMYQAALWRGFNFSNLNLSNAYFSDKNFEDANFRDDDLRYTDFNNANLKNASFSHVIFEDTNFTDALLDGTKFEYVDLTKTTLTSDQLKNAKIGSGVTMPLR